MAGRIRRDGRREGGWGPVLLAALALAAALGASALACGGEETITTAAPEVTKGVARSDLLLASTTSTEDSGLFDALVPAFNEVFPHYTVKVVAVGSGEALKLGETGDADVLLVHSPAAEETFMENGFGIERNSVMYNDFVIVGPATDPAAIKGMNSASAALAKVATVAALFFSRGDGSGTHGKEQALWKEAGIEPSGRWYQITGQGMGETLTITDQKSGYTLSDRATYLAKRTTLALEILVEGDMALLNQYHVITAKNGRNPRGAADFLNWIVSYEAQELIAGYGVEAFGRPLFTPDSGMVE